MSELDNNRKAFGNFLKRLARTAECYGSLDFAAKLNDFKPENADTIEKGTVDRWYNGIHLPEPGHQKVIIRFFQQKRLFVRNFKDEIFNEFYLLYDISESAQKIYRAEQKERKIFQSLEVKDSNGLYRLLKAYQHDYNTTHIITDIINIQGENSELLRNAAIEIVLDCKYDEKYLGVASICANIICTIKNARLDEPIKNALEENVFEIGTRDFSAKSAMMSSLAYALARNGSDNALKANLIKLTRDNAWATHDYNIIRRYYGSDDKQRHAIIRHMSDQNRSGLMMAHDAHRLVRMLEIGNDLDVTINKIILPGLRNSASILHKFGLQEEAKILLSKFSKK